MFVAQPIEVYNKKQAAYSGSFFQSISWTKPNVQPHSKKGTMRVHFITVGSRAAMSGKPGR